MHACRQSWIFFVAPAALIILVGCKGTAPDLQMLELNEDPYVNMASVDSPPQRLAPSKATKPEIAKQPAPITATATKTAAAKAPSSTSSNQPTKKQVLRSKVAASSAEVAQRRSVAAKTNQAAQAKGKVPSADLAPAKTRLSTNKPARGKAVEALLAANRGKSAAQSQSPRQAANAKAQAKNKAHAESNVKAKPIATPKPTESIAAKSSNKKDDFDEISIDVKQKALRRLVAQVAKDADATDQPNSPYSALANRLKDLPKLPDYSEESADVKPIRIASSSGAVTASISDLETVEVADLQLKHEPPHRAAVRQRTPIAKRAAKPKATKAAPLIRTGPKVAKAKTETHPLVQVTLDPLKSQRNGQIKTSIAKNPKANPVSKPPAPPTVVNVVDELLAKAKAPETKTAQSRMVAAQSRKTATQRSKKKSDIPQSKPDSSPSIQKVAQTEQPSKSSVPPISDLSMIRNSVAAVGNTNKPSSRPPFVEPSGSKRGFVLPTDHPALDDHVADSSSPTVVHSGAINTIDVSKFDLSMPPLGAQLNRLPHQLRRDEFKVSNIGLPNPKDLQLAIPQEPAKVQVAAVAKNDHSRVQQASIEKAPRKQPSVEQTQPSHSFSMPNIPAVASQASASQQYQLPPETPPASQTAPSIETMSDEDLYQALLKRLTDPTKAETQAEKNRREIMARHLMVLAGNPDVAVDDIKGLSDQEQQYLRHQLQGLWKIIDPEGHPVAGRRFSAALPTLREATRHLAAASDALEVRGMSFCTEIEAYGQIKPFPDRRFQRGQAVILYCEIENFVAKQNDSGYTTHLLGTYVIYDESGKKVVSQPLPEDKQLSRSYLRDYFIAYQMNLPKNLKAGKYQLELTMQDAISEKYGQSRIDFQIKE